MSDVAPRSPDGRWWWDGATWQPTGEGRAQGFKAGTSRALVACVLIGVVPLTFAGSLMAFVPYYLDLEIPAVLIDTLISVSSGFVVAQGIAWTGGAAAFGIWLHRVIANLPTLGEPAPYLSPGWAVACLFVPVAGTFLPFLVIHQAWSASDPSGRGRAPRISWLLTGWWTAWLMANPISLLIQREVLAFLLPPSRVSIPFPWYVVVTWLLLELAAAALAIAVIIGLDRRQNERSRTN